MALPNRRTLPVFGISGSVAGHNPILLVDDPLAADELMATLELGYLLNLTQHDRAISPSGCSISLVAAFFYLDPAAAG